MRQLPRPLIHGSPVGPMPVLVRFSRRLFSGPLFCCPLALLVCAACPVSVSVRPARPSVSEATRHSGHHSRFVQKSLLLATAAPVLASMSSFLLEPIHRGEPFHPALGRSRRVAVVQRARGSGRLAGIALRDQKEMVQRGPSLRFITCASERKSLSAGAFSAASLPARRWVVTRRLAQILAQLRA